MGEWRHLLDVARAPSGRPLARGMWFTYDLDVEMLSRHVAPALVDINVAQRGERYRRTAGFQRPDGADPQLIVVADGRPGRMSNGPGLRWAQIVPIRGRTQHAKFGILEFRGATDAATIRCFVSSANLTANGIGRNREVLLVEERTLKSTLTSPSLFGDLLDAVRVLAQSLSAGEASLQSRKAIDEFLNCFDAQSPKAGLVRHSLDRTRRILPPRPTHEPTASEVDIVSPAFAAPGDEKVVDLLAPWLAASTALRWHIGANKQGLPVVPAGAWRALKRKCTPNLCAVAESDEPDNETESRRPLHAKLIALSGKDGVRVLAGSANFSYRGLGGRNRELSLWWSEPAGTDVLDGLPSAPAPGPPTTTKAMSREPDVTLVTLSDVRIVHAAQDSEGMLVGRLEVIGGSPKDPPVGIRIGNHWYPIADLANLVFHLGTALISIRHRSGIESKVPIDYSGVPPALWLQRRDVDRVVDPDLQVVLDVIRVAADHRSRQLLALHTGGPLPPSPDKYLTQLAQPLVQLARHRHELAKQKDGEELERALEDFRSSLPRQKWNPDVEEKIARVLLGLDTAPTTRLLTALKAVT